MGWAALWLAPRTPAGAAKEPARAALLLQRWVLFKLMFCSGAVKIQVLPQLHGFAKPEIDSIWPLAEVLAAGSYLGSPAPAVCSGCLQQLRTSGPHAQACLL